MSYMGETRSGARGFFGAREDRHDLFDTRIDLAVPNIHGGLGTKEFSHLGEPASVAIGVITSDEIPNRLPSNDLPNLHENPFSVVG